MKKSILLRTNLLVCLIIIIGFLMTAILSYQANYSASMENIEQVSTLTSEGIYYQISSLFTRPVHISLTMANDSLLMDALADEDAGDDPHYVATIREYLGTYRKKYGFDSVFLVSSASGRYYNYEGMDRVLTPDNPENTWFYELLDSPDEYRIVVDNDEVAGAENRITVFVNCKLMAHDGTLLGVVGVGLAIDDLQDLLKSYEEQFDIDAFLVDSSGRIEISAEHTGYENVGLFDLFNYDEDARRQILNPTKEGLANSLWTEAEQNQSYIVTRYLPDLDWHLIVQRDTGALMESMNHQLLLTMLILVGILSVILFVISYVIRSFNHQIVTLTQSVEQERHTVFEEATYQLFENIYELDITHNCPANRAMEEYFENLGAAPGTPYDKALHIVADKQIKEEFRQGYIDTFTPENVLRAHQEGRETLQYDFMISTGGAYYWMRIIARIVRFESDGSIHLLTYRKNIDAEKQQENRMRELAHTDEMTGMLNQTTTHQQVEEQLRKNPNRQYAFFIFDIDNFKQVNDRFGHAFGDNVIREFTGVLRSYFHQGELLGRVGGDEFVAFTAIPDEKWAESKAKTLSKALCHLYTEGEMSWKISASIGVSFAPQHGRDCSTLFKNADTALYQIKKRGKNGYAIYQETEGE